MRKLGKFLINTTDCSVCMVTHTARVWINRVKLNRENENCCATVKYYQRVLYFLHLFSRVL